MKKENSNGGDLLSIVGFDDREQVHPNDVNLPEWMPKHEFFMLIVAPAGCGKTTLILNLLLRIYKNYFNEVKVFSPTIHNDQKWTHLTSTRGILRKNPHRKLFEKVKLKDVPREDGDKGGTKGDQNEQLEAKGISKKDLTADLCYFENFDGSTSKASAKGKKGAKGSSRHLNKGKRMKMGKEYVEYWKNQNPTDQALLKSPEEIIQKELRLQKLASVITKPTPPFLAQHCRQFNAMFGLGSSSFEPKGGQINPELGGPGIGVSRGTRWGGRGPCGMTGTTPSSLGRNQERRRVIWNKKQETDHSGSQTAQQNHQDNTKAEQDPETVVGGHASGKKEKKSVPGAVLHDSMFEEYSEETLQTIMDNQDKIVRHLSDMGKDMRMADHLCLVFDDMVGSGLFNAKRNNAFKRLTVRRRHFCSSVIGVVQAYKEFPKTSRNNTNIYVLFKIDSDEEIMGIYKDFPCGLRPEVWRRVYDYCTKEPYSFMMINLQVKDPRYRIVKNFNEPLNVPVYERELQEGWALSLGTNIQDPNSEEKEEADSKNNLLINKQQLRK